MNPEEIIKVVETEYKEGYTKKEIKTLLRKFPNLDSEVFLNHLKNKPVLLKKNKPIHHNRHILVAIQKSL